MDNKLLPKKSEERHMLACQNCEELFEEGANFCPHCGQKTNDDLTIGVLFYNTISNYFSFDARFLKSFFPLMFKPGYLASKFIEGKRLLYLHPAQMYLFVSVIFFFIISFSTRELASKADEINKQVVESEVIDELSEEAEKAIDSIVIRDNLIKTKNNLTEEELAAIDSIVKSKYPVAIDDKDDVDQQEATIKLNSNGDVDVSDEIILNRKVIDSLLEVGVSNEEIYKEMGMSEDAGFFEKKLYKNLLNLYKGSGAGSIVQAFFDSIPLAMFFLLPIFALILKIFYFNRGKYAHHLVFSFYYFSFLFLVFAILFAVNRFLYDIPDGIDWLLASSTFIYFIIALRKFYSQSTILTLVKGSIISFIFLLMIIPVAFGIVAGFSFLFY
jgi:hypothetical protein